VNRIRRRYWKKLLRQIWWASVPVWSFGLLSFALFLRLALERRRRKDWAITWAYLAAGRGSCQLPVQRDCGRGEHGVQVGRPLVRPPNKC